MHGVLRRKQSLDDEVSLPAVAEPLQRIPVETAAHLRGHEARNLLGAGLLHVALHRLELRNSRRDGRERPGRMAHQLPDEFRAHLQSDAEIIAQVARTPRRERNVDGDDERFVTRAVGPVDDVVGDFVEARDVELKPGILRGEAGVILERGRARRRQRAGNVSLNGCARDRFLAARAHQVAKANGCRPERQRPAASEQGRRQIALLDIDEHARLQTDIVEGGGVALHARFRAGATVEIVEHEARQPPSCRRAQIGDGGDVHS